MSPRAIVIAELRLLSQISFTQDTRDMFASRLREYASALIGLGC